MRERTYYRRQFAVSFFTSGVGAAQDVTNNVIDSINDGRDGVVSASMAISPEGEGVALLIVYEAWRPVWHPSMPPYEFDEDGVLVESEEPSS